MSRSKFRRKLVDLNSTSNIYRLSGLGRHYNAPVTHSLADNAGYYTLRNAQTALGATLSLPIYAFDVTSVPNTYNGTYTYPITGWLASAAAETKGAAITWSQIAAPPDTTSSFQAEQAGINPSPGEGDLLDWVEAKFMFYAPTTLPVRVNIDFVTFRDVGVVPGGEYAVSGTATSNAAQVAFWESMLKKYMYSPLESGNANLEQKYIKYLHRESFILDCKTSIEPESTHFKMVNIFKRMNRKVTYKWLDPAQMNLVPGAAGGGAAGTDWILNGYGSSPNYWTVHPKARIFMIVRAFSANVNNNNAFNPAYHPSFDLVLRTKHSTLGA